MPREVLWFDCNLTASTRMKFQPRSNSSLTSKRTRRPPLEQGAMRGRKAEAAWLLAPLLASEWLWVYLSCPICILGIIPALPTSLDSRTEVEAHGKLWRCPNAGTECVPCFTVYEVHGIRSASLCDLQSPCLKLINPLQRHRKLRRRSQMLDGRGRARSRVRLRPRAQGGAMGSQRAGAAEPTERDRVRTLTATRLRRAPGGARVPGATRTGGGQLRRV